MAQPVLIAPLWEVSTAVWNRLRADSNTSGYALYADGGTGNLNPGYLAIAPAYQGVGANVQTGVDPETGVYVVLQIGAYAANDAGGAKTVSDMMQDVALALSAADMTVSVRTASGTKTSQPLATVVETDVLTRDLVDGADGQLFAQRLVRLRFLILT